MRIYSTTFAVFKMPQIILTYYAQVNENYELAAKYYQEVHLQISDTLAFQFEFICFW